MEPVAHFGCASCSLFAVKREMMDEVPHFVRYFHRKTKIHGLHCVICSFFFARKRRLLAGKERKFMGSISSFHRICDEIRNTHIFLYLQCEEEFLEELLQKLQAISNQFVFAVLHSFEQLKFLICLE